MGVCQRLQLDVCDVILSEFGVLQQQKLKGAGVYALNLKEAWQMYMDKLCYIEVSETGEMTKRPKQSNPARIFF